MLRFLPRIMILIGMVLMALWIHNASPPVWLMLVVASGASTIVTVVDVLVTRRTRAARTREDGGRP